MSASALRLHLDGITRSFPGVIALDDIALRVRPAEVHALVGENGAGKSTLLKILSGVLRADRGTIRIDGAAVTVHAPADARRAGIAMIHQELQQVPELTVAQTMFLGRAMTRAGGVLLDRAAMERRAAATLAPLDDAIDPRARLGGLRVAQRQIVEIARALLDEPRVIAMDEPTSSLTPGDFDRLAVVIGRLRDRGVSVIYVSHKLDEVLRICTRATVLRDGRVVAEAVLPDTTERQLVAMMVGRDIDAGTRRSFATGKVALAARGLSRGRHVVDVSFDLHRGEVLGLAGLIGAGRTELLRLLYGLDQPDAGSIALHGRAMRIARPRAAIRAGIGLVPEERKREGIIPLLPVMINATLPSLGRFARAGLLRRGALRRAARTLLGGLQLRPLLPDRPIRLFSGGNQQKAIIARWLGTGAQILLFDEPTRGIDVGAKQEIYRLIESLAESGKAVLVVSSELAEILRLADRVLVMRQGRLAATLPRAGLTEERIMHHAASGLGA